jgi:hypothetical protein
MNAQLLTLDVQFRSHADKLPPIEQQAAELFKLAQYLSSWSPLLSRWYVNTGRKEDSRLYEAFDANGPTAAALAAWNKMEEDSSDIHSIIAWNGAEANTDSASIVSRYSVLGRPNSFSFRLRINPIITDWRQGCDLIRFATTIWPAVCATFNPFWYNEQKVFKDRLGVGWMLYLPRVLTAQQVPEARALEPIMGKNEKGEEIQTGTIVVSVTDEPFSIGNPEHIEIANSIEIRLVDQDLLPRIYDL